MPDKKVDYEKLPTSKLIDLSNELLEKEEHDSFEKVDEIILESRHPFAWMNEAINSLEKRVDELEKTNKELKEKTEKNLKEHAHLNGKVVIEL